MICKDFQISKIVYLVVVSYPECTVENFIENSRNIYCKLHRSVLIDFINYNLQFTMSQLKIGFVNSFIKSNATPNSSFGKSLPLALVAFCFLSMPKTFLTIFSWAMA